VAKKLEVVLPNEAEGLRLDQCLARYFEPLSRRGARVALELGCVFVGKKRVKVASRRVQAGQVVRVHLGEVFERALAGDGPVPAPLDVLFEDEHLVVVNKAPGVPSAPTLEGDVNCLPWLLQQRAPAKSQRHNTIQVVHRLDVPTSGVLVFAKTAPAQRQLSEMFKRHDLMRRYDAFVHGRYPVDSETLSTPLDGKSARSHVQVDARFEAATRLRVTLETGRTHQIRLHTSGRGHFVLGDRRYGKRTPIDPPRLALHAAELSFDHPISKQRQSFVARLPHDLATWAAGLRPCVTTS